jgi:magnesium-protoporphyrin O-methyltransferase
MDTLAYERRRGELRTYFDRTAAEAWARLTSTAPVSRIRATVRAGRDAMRATILNSLPADLTQRRVLDAGCGTGALSRDLSLRGAEVVAVDLSPTLVGLAEERVPQTPQAGRIEFRVGDMCAVEFGRFDHVVAMDSLIHYDAADVVRVLGDFAARTRYSIVFTFAPKTPALALMWAVGRLFPRGDRAPAIEPVAERRLRRAIAAAPALAGWRIGRTRRIASGFYKSQAMELVKA